MQLPHAYTVETLLMVPACALHQCSISATFKTFQLYCPTHSKVSVWNNTPSATRRGSNEAVRNLPPDVLADGPRARQYTPARPTSRRGRLGTATLLPLFVAEGVLSHTLTFECVGQCSWKVLNCRRDSAVVQGSGGNHQRCRHYVRVR